jgi:hypothetical protein
MVRPIPKLVSDKFLKNQKLVSDSINMNEIPVDAYGIDVALTSWALKNISTKELKQLIKQEKI